jgi:hypothetical protein
MTSARQWLPRSIECLRGYTAKQFSQGPIAGLTVGLVALPLAMAFAISYGAPPPAGPICSTGDIGCGVVRCRLQHGGVAGDRHHPSPVED